MQSNSLDLRRVFIPGIQALYYKGFTLVCHQSCCCEVVSFSTRKLNSFNGDREQLTLVLQLVDDGLGDKTN